MSDGATVEVYEARDLRRVDTASRLLRMEYLPLTMYVVTDARDSVAQLVVVAWQQLLWRFSERLSETDKAYFAPQPVAIARRSDSAVVTWAYPNLDTRDDDLRDITPYRNSYWSVDVLRMNAPFTEIYRGDLRSYPQFGAYDPRTRFVAGGPFDRAFADSALPYAAARAHLSKTTAAHASDSSRR